MSYRILAFDGGPHIATGLRVLIQIETAKPGFLERTDHFVGGSSGGITALYIARRLTDGDAALDILRDAIPMTEKLYDCFAPVDGDALADSFANLLVGASAMIGNRDLRQMLVEELGGGHLSDLSRRVSIVSTAKAEPYLPALWSNFGPQHLQRHDVTLVEAGMHTSAFPFWVPVRGGQLDGCMWTNAGGTAGLSAAIAAAPDAKGRSVLLETAVMLQIGGNDGLSDLSNRYLPGQPSPPEPDRALVELGFPPTPPTIDDNTSEADLNGAEQYALHVYGEVFASTMDRVASFGPDDDSGRVSRAAERVAGVVKKVEGRVKTLLKPMERKANQEALERKRKTDGAEPHNESWGWSEWLGYSGNPAFILQQWLTSLGRGSELSSRNFLGDRVLRVGPVTFLGTNVALLCVAFGHCDAIYWFADLSAQLWANPTTSKRFSFTPGWDETQTWAAANWMNEG